MNSYERFALWSGGVDKQRVTLSGDRVQFISHERQQLQVKVQIQPVQEGRGTPSLNNVRPITGWNAVRVTRSGGFQSDEYSISFPIPPGTVYGGVLDATSGKLTIDRILCTKNTADMNNSEEHGGWRDSIWRDYFGPGINMTFRQQLLNIGTVFGVNTQQHHPCLFLSLSSYGKTQTEWQALAIDVQIIVPLYNPVTYQLTPQEITALIGANNIWADAGPVEVTYEQ